ncbi:hypothetical protein AB0G81_39800, partial [Streptomyces asoensis]
HVGDPVMDLVALDPLAEGFPDGPGEGLGPEGQKAQEEIGLYMGGLDSEASKFDEKLAIRKARMAARAAG